MSLVLSAVVCTHNRPDDLRRCLDALARLEDEAEVSVVDSASQPSCQELVLSYGRGIPNLAYIREEQPGLSRARNVGVAAASGEIVAFLDDDAAPRADWARRIVAAFDADDRIGCVGGACLPLFPDEPRPRWLSDRLLQFAATTRFGPDGREARSSAEWPFGANMAFRREALAAAGPFSERLGRQRANLLSGDETPVIEAVRRHGWKIWLDPAAIVDHTVHGERCRSRYYWRRLWWAGVTRARSTERALALGLKLVAAVPVRFFLYLITRDRVHLYRTAETAGFLHERARLLRRPV